MFIVGEQTESELYTIHLRNTVPYLHVLVHVLFWISEASLLDFPIQAFFKRLDIFAGVFQFNHSPPSQSLPAAYFSWKVTIDLSRKIRSGLIHGPLFCSADKRDFFIVVHIEWLSVTVTGAVWIASDCLWIQRCPTTTSKALAFGATFHRDQSTKSLVARLSLVYSWLPIIGGQFYTRFYIQTTANN